jgi:hypothetical protein
MRDLVKPTYRLPSHLTQPVAATVLVPQNRAMTLVARKAHIMMVALAQQQHADGRKPAEGFVAPLREILVATGAAEATRPLLKRYLEQMMHTLVEYRPLDLESVVVEMHDGAGQGDGSGDLVQDPIVSEERIFPLMAEVRIFRRKSGDLWVHWFYPPTIIDEIIRPTRWSQVNLDVVRSMRTYAAVMLYLVCVRYQNNPGGVTKRYSVKELDLMLRSRPEKKHRTWRRLKTDVVKAAVAEVNELADIAIELVEYKMGREVTHAQFNVRKQAVKNVQGGAVDVTSVVLGAQLGLAENLIEELESEFGTARVRDGLERVDRFVTMNPGKRPGNAVEYLRSTIRNAATEGKAPASDVQRTREESRPAAQTREVAERERNERAARAYGAIELEFRELAARDQVSWTHRYAASLAADHPWLKSKLSKSRLEEGAWQSATIKHSVLAFYAENTHGAGWRELFATPVLIQADS